MRRDFAAIDYCSRHTPSPNGTRTFGYAGLASSYTYATDAHDCSLTEARGLQSSSPGSERQEAGRIVK